MADSMAGSVAGARPGRRLGVDVGTVRVGVAMSDPDGLLASPLVTLGRDPEPSLVGGTDEIALTELVLEHDVRLVYVGLPLHLSGVAGSAAQAALEYAQRLAARIAPIPVRLIDERLSTRTAQRAMTRSGRSTRKQRSVIDQGAAVVFLQAAIDAERAHSGFPGEPVSPAS